jgi:hypothetical protein
VDAEPARCLADVAAAVGEDALDVLPLGAGERRGLEPPVDVAREALSRERGEQLVGVDRLR